MLVKQKKSCFRVLGFFFSLPGLSWCPQKKKCFGCEKVRAHVWAKLLHHHLFFIVRHICETWKCGFSARRHSRKSISWSGVKPREVRVAGCLKCTCTGRWVTGSVTLVAHRLLHHVLDARQRLLYWHWGLWATSLLGELQDGHVAQGTHLPHLQPLNEAPVRKRMTEDGIFRYGGLYCPLFWPFLPWLGQGSS